jgi:hypothetical protein
VVPPDRGGTPERDAQALIRRAVLRAVVFHRLTPESSSDREADRCMKNGTPGVGWNRADGTRPDRRTMDHGGRVTIPQSGFTRPDEFTSGGARR